MLNANFIGDGDGDGDGYPGIWLSFCDICKAAVSTLYCHTHSGYFCNSCDELIHADNSLALPHERVSIFTACENKPAAFSYKADAASSQLGCDADKYLNNSLALHRRDQVTVPPFPDQFYAPSTIYPTGTMFNTGEEVTALTVDEHQTDSWLLLEPETQMNTGFKFVQELSQSFGVECNSLTEYQYQDQTIHEQLYRSLEVDSELNAMVPPVQTIEEKEKERLQKKQTDYFDRKYEASKAAVSNTTSSSQTVPMSGILAEATASDISSSYTRYPQRMTDLPKISFLIPLQFTQETREEKVLRYREKKKARRFEKKIRYASRKAYAEARPRVNGRFAKKSEVDFEADEMFSTEESG